MNASTRPSTLPHLLAAAIVFVAAAAPLACNGCRGTTASANGGAPNANATNANAMSASAAPDAFGAPTIRLYLVSDLAGVVEPCGCTKDQLGGLDHFAAYVASESARAPSSVTVAAGPLFFMDPALKGERADQETTKAETIAKAMKTLGLAAFAPAENDFAAGRDKLDALAKSSGATMLARGGVVRAIHGVKVGFVGVGVGGGAEVKASVAEVKKEGAEMVVALSSLGRGESKRIADAVPELTAILVGSPQAAGEANTQGAPAERVGNVIIAQAANHLQSVGVLDLYVRGGSFSFADATGIEREQKRADLTRRIDDLHIKIANWERDKSIPRGDLDARKADVERLQKERDALDTAPPPASGSFFRYTVKEIRDSLGKDAAVSGDLSAYYKAVNEHNKLAFANRLPQPHTADQAVYIGVNACANCHANAKKFWETTKHAHAYKTLSDQFKEFNLDCVSCHVTGYEQPGGSTVTHVDRLEAVQCEVCHGPGSKHGLRPNEPGLIVAHPKPDTCLSCHHPPHVEQFDAAAKLASILGPGHGRPMP